MSSHTLTLLELQQASGVPARTLRRWIKRRLLPKPIGRGRSARYGDEHLLRAKAIHGLRLERRSLRQIQERLSTSSREQIGAGLARPLTLEARPVTLEARPGPAPEPAYPFTSWQVVQLSAGLALLVNPARGPAVRQLAEQLYRQCAELQGTP
jgi:DNA-binding transcriptional MerR regulator